MRIKHAIRILHGIPRPGPPHSIADNNVHIAHVSTRRIEILPVQRNAHVAHPVVPQAVALRLLPHLVNLDQPPLRAVGKEAVWQDLTVPG
ncbi:hypothetical protein HYQ46_002774 [Verticillium longisporum]|nr:hypothetical protein HYQ46_002774 [Verticillium longisporum]